MNKRRNASSLTFLAILALPAFIQACGPGKGRRDNSEHSETSTGRVDLPSESSDVIPAAASPETNSDTQETTVSCDGVKVTAEQNPVSLVKTHPAGTTFCFQPGLYRLSEPILARTGDKFIGTKGVVLRGSKALTRFKKEGKLWVAEGQKQQGMVHGVCEDDYEGCKYPDNVFVDGTGLARVMKIGDVKAGTFFFDYAADKIYLATDPAGHSVEAAVASAAILGATHSESADLANAVTVTGLTVEMFAVPAQFAAIQPHKGQAWIIEGNEVRLNHGGGIALSTGSKARRNFVHHNGQQGIVGVGDDLLVEDNEISYNQLGRFNLMWEGGGTKFALTKRLVVRNNFVHHNMGTGLWTDIDNVDVIYEGNRVEDNTHGGIFHEVSFAATIRNNIIERNGLGFKHWMWGAGIIIAASQDVEIHGNTLKDNANGISLVQQDRGSGNMGAWLVKNVNVHHNTIYLKEGGYVGAGQDFGSGIDICDPARKIRFEDNVYHLTKFSHFYIWNGNYRTKAEWQGYGHDKNSKFISQ